MKTIKGKTTDKIMFICENCHCHSEFKISNYSDMVINEKDNSGNIGCEISISNLYHAKCSKCGCSMIKRNYILGAAYLNLINCGLNVVSSSDGCISIKIDKYGNAYKELSDLPNISFIVSKEQFNKLFKIRFIFEKYNNIKYSAFNNGKVTTIKISSISPNKNEDIESYVKECIKEIYLVSKDIANAESKKY